LAKESTLYIFSDGPKSNSLAELKLIQNVRSICSNVNGFKSLNIIQSDTNKGLASSIIDGVSKIIDKHSRVIVLEDDIVTAPEFLKFMNSCLSIYENCENVAHVSGFSFDIRTSKDHFFLRQTHCWGWATWKRAWIKLDLDSNRLLNSIAKQNKLNEFDLLGSCDYSGQLQRNISKEIVTWAVKWYATCFLDNALAVHPRLTLCENIGLDGSGTNSKTNFLKTSLNRSITLDIKKRQPVLDVEEEKTLSQFFKRKNNIKSYRNRVIVKLFQQHAKFEILLGEVYKKILNLHPSIRIHKTAKISYNSKIRIKFGGSIVIGEGTEILDGVRIYTYGGNIKIGNRCSINHLTIIYGHGGTTIGNDVLIAGHSMIIPNNHLFNRLDTPISSQGNSSIGIIIMDDVWIGHSSSILDGVIIGSGSIVGAGSVVTKSIKNLSIATGVPAITKRIR